MDDWTPYTFKRYAAKEKIENKMLLDAISDPLLLSMFLLKWDFSTCKNYSKTTITGAI